MYGFLTPTLVWRWDIRVTREPYTCKNSNEAAPDNIPKGSAPMQIIASGWFEAEGSRCV
jgi:hypothetical protein